MKLSAAPVGESKTWVNSSHKHDQPSVEIESGQTSASLTFVHQAREVFLLKNGTVKSFDHSKGYGWIVPHDGTSDLFVHKRSIKGDDIRTITIGARVTYESRFVRDQGLEAFNVSPSE